MKKTPRLLMLLSVATVSIVAAQDPAFMDTANQPGPEVFYGRALGMFEWGSSDPTSSDFTRSRLVMRGQYGLTQRIALMGDFALAAYNPDRGSSVSGLTDSRLAVKLHLFPFFFSPESLVQVGVLGGVIVPGSERDLSRFGNDAGVTAGIVASAHWPRHAWNASLTWLAADHNTNTAEINLGYLFRLAPDQLDEKVHQPGAWYFQAELLQTYEESGVHRIHLTPGILYSQQNWAAEAVIRFPLSERQTDEELDIAIASGIRFLY